MPFEQLLALVTLAVAGSFTPGPNNTIATITGANHGLRAVVPHMLGVPFGFSTMLAAGSLGAAALIVAHPLLAALIKWAGIAYLLLIGWQVARSGGSSDRPLARPLTFWQSAAFQYANPKAWMLATATAGAFSEQGDTWLRTALVCAVFSLTAFASLVLWGWLGVALRGWLANGARLRVFNVTMGALLAGTAAWMAFQ
jgi:threonine/homoserine/homoserine lactone efflux protein